MNTTVDFNSFINALDQVNKDKYSFHIFIPSLQRDVPFLQITTSQQKTIIKSIIDSQVYNTEFIFAVYNIIKTNCIDKSIDVNTLTLLDKICIIMNLRCKSISNKYQMQVDKDGIEGTFEIDLDELVERCKQLPNFPNKTLTHENYILNLRPPTIGMEYKIERDIRSKSGKSKDQEVTTPEQLREVVGEAFITELIKYVQQVEVVTEESNMKIDFDNLSCKDAQKVLERLPVKTIEHVLKYAEGFNTLSSNILKIQVPAIDSETKETIFQDQEIPVNGNFFIVS